VAQGVGPEFKPRHQKKKKKQKKTRHYTKATAYLEEGRKRQVFLKEMKA
jgi:hypothetical protein